MKRVKAFFAIGLMSSMLLAGCQRDKEPLPESSISVSDKSASETSSDGVSKEISDEEKIATEVISEEEKTAEEAKNVDRENNSNSQSDLISGLRITHNDNNYYGENYHRLIIRHNYELLKLSDDTQKEYPELNKAIMMVNDLIATDEANSYYAAYKQAVKVENDDSYDHPVADEDWNIFIRRADKDIVSILVKITRASYEDYNHVRYLAYNIKTETGEIIKISDIIEDEDALYDMLSRKFLEVMKADYEGLFAGGNDMSEADIFRNLEQAFYEEQIVWTLDPQGVSFWLSSMNLSPVSMESAILFSEDDKGIIFSSDVRENIPDTWVTQLYPGTYELVDADDDGKEDRIYVMEVMEFNENSDSSYVSGILVDFNGKETEVPAEGDVYDFEFSLVHQNGKSLLLVQYKEYEADIQELYELNKNGASKTDLITGWVCGGPDETFYDFEEYSYITPLITDPAYFQMAVTTWLLSTTDVVMEYQITDDGKFKSLSERGTILEGDRYEISLKMPMKGVPVVNATTGEETKETVNLNSGDTLKLMYSDTQSYVDCLTKDNKLVRIYVLMDEDIGGCINTNGKNVSLNEMFDGMVYAG